MSARRSSIAVFLLAVFVVFACRNHKQGPLELVNPQDVAPPIATDTEPGLVIRLSNADESGSGQAATKRGKATDLDAADTKKVLARLPKLEGKADDTKEFALRAGSKPAPRTGATVLGAFPPAKAKPPKTKAHGGPLEVTRVAPTGDVPLAPHLSVSFSEPMVPVTSIAELASKDVPVRLDPMPEGKWRWVGAKTLLFEPAERLPMATSYEVTVPAGTKSANGSKLAKAKHWTFQTPPPSVQTFHPQGGPTRLQPVMFASFDQAIDRNDVLGTISLTLPKGKSVGVRLAEEGEIEGDDVVRQLAAQATEGRWLAFVPASPLPPDTHITVEIGPGTPSAEGPRTTTDAAKYSFDTFGPMKLTEDRCGWDGNCPPGTPFELIFSNPIDAEKFDPSMVTVDPPLQDQNVQIYGNHMYVQGRAKSRGRHKVVVSAKLADDFGQRLGKDETRKFRVTAAPESLFAPNSGLVVLDPAAKGKFAVYSVNHDKLAVRAWRVTPSDWSAYLKAVEATGRDSRDLAPPGKKVIDTTVGVDGADDEIVETGIDLSPALKGGRGHVVLVVEQTRKAKNPWEMQRVLAWVQVTDIGLSGHVDDEQMLVWTTSLADGSPLAGTQVELSPSAAKAKTDAHGLAALTLPSKSAQLIVARRGDDVAFLPESIWWWNGEGSWKKNEQGSQVHWFVFDDRHLYRPGEDVHVKGWLRRVDMGKGGDVGALAPDQRQVKYVLSDSRGNQVSKGTLDLNAFGAFDTKLALPDTMNLGTASLTLDIGKKGTWVPGAEYWHAIEVQEFRRPEYEVDAQLAEGPHMVGGDTIATVSAQYYAGGPLANAEVTWQVSSSPGHYQPPGHDRFIFGKWDPWWMFWRWYDETPDPALQPKYQSFSAQTDATGKHHLGMAFVSVNPPRAMSVSAQATVMDVNRQAWTSSTSTVVHPADLYVGLRSDRAFVQAGEDIELDAIVVDIDGKVATGVEIAVRSVRIEYVQEKGKMVEKERDPQTCKHKSGTDAVRCTLPAKKGGSYRVTADIRDADGRANRTETTIWVAGGDLPEPRDVSAEQVLLIPDREEYEAGQTAKIAVAAPWPDAYGLVTLRRSGVVKSESIALKGSSTIVEVPITEDMTPNMHVQVDLVGAAPRRGGDGKIDPKLPKRTAFATGIVSLTVPPRQRTLALEVAPERAKIEPGGTTSIAVDVKDAAGKAVADAEVALVVVDEAVLALTGYALPDPVAAFYGWRPPGVRDHHLRSQVVLAKPEDLVNESSNAPGGGDAGGAEQKVRASSAEAPPPPSPAPQADYFAADEAMEEAAPVATKSAGKKGKDGNTAPIAMREDFSALALFSPSVHTDAKGHATVEVKLPDNLTRYRIMAVAVAGDKHFGKAESSITARLPLMVRPSAPRFLNFGDEMELPVVLQNQTDASMTVDVAVRTHNATLTAGAGRRVEVPANDRVEVRFPTKAEQAGTARFQVGAVAGTWADAASFELPVWTPATTEAFATYGQIDSGAIAQPVQAPGGVFPQFGGLEITTSSTALQELTDATLYLVRYPYDCSEQIASRVLAIAALRDVLEAFDAEGLPPPKELVAGVKTDVERLSRMQGDDGGFSFWGSGWPSWPYLTAHVTHALARAKAKGFSVPTNTFNRATKYLANVESHLPHDMSEDAKRFIRAYALYVLDVAGTPDAAKARKLVDEVGVEKLPLEALAWLLPTLADDPKATKMVGDIHRHFGNRVSETAGAANFTTHYSDGDHVLLHSARRADALILEALIETDAKNDLIPKLVRGLLDHRTAGRWSSTQENAFVLLALDRYFNVFEKTTPSFVARAWLGESYAGDHTFKGRTTERHHVEVPMQWLTDHKKGTDLVLAKEGKGRMYYRVGMRYAPRDLKLPPYDAGFVVQRRYEAVDDDKDVTRDADGTWHIKAGARVRVRLTMLAESRRYHVALVDPLPAGLEPLNPELATTGALPADPQGDDDSRGGYWWWWRPWYEHQNMRDERVEAFTSLLWEGVHDYDYIARATTPGNFVVPPPKAEEMYHPETFGRGAGDRVIVE